MARRLHVYIAGSYLSAERIHELSEELEGLGIVVTGVWFQPHDPIEEIWDKQFGGRVAEAMSLRDFDAIDRADIVIIDTLEKSTSGGRNVELGYSLGRRKRIILVGQPENIFFSLIREQYDSWEDLIIMIEGGEL